MAYSAHTDTAQAVAAVVRGSPANRKRYSAHKISDGILHWYDKCKLCPRGISTNAGSVRDWALRNGEAIRKMDSRMHCRLDFEPLSMGMHCLGELLRLQSSSAFADGQTSRTAKPSRS